MAEASQRSVSSQASMGGIKPWLAPVRDAYKLGRPIRAAGRVPGYYGRKRRLTKGGQCAIGTWTMRFGSLQTRQNFCSKFADDILFGHDVLADASTVGSMLVYF